MITLTLKELEDQEKLRIQKQSKFEEWCIEHDKSMLSSWKRLNGVTDGDLLAARIIKYPEYQLSDGGLFTQAMITTLGDTVIAKIDEYHFNDDILDFCYVHNSDLLHQLLKHQLSRSNRERELDSRYQYEKKHGYPPLLPDEELPLKARSYISGPFCDLDKLQTKDQNIKERKLKFCGWCGQYTHDLPSFLIARNCLCYNCAKLAYLRLEPIAGIINNQSKEKHQAALKQHQNWQKEFRHHRYNKGIIQKLIELLSGNKSSYDQLFLKDNPEPETSILPPITQPVLCPEQSPFIGRNTTRKWILKRDSYECQICGMPDVLQSSQRKIKSQLEVHHIIPRSSSGGNNRTNLITLCVECHNAEKWFGHVRAYVDVDAYEQCVEWNWDLMPDFLISTDHELLNDQQLFCKQTYFKSHDYWLEYRKMLDDTYFVIDI